jgi:hypothetical protein
MEYIHKTLCKKMFCAKKVTKLPDLTVLIQDLESFFVILDNYSRVKRINFKNLQQ